MAAETKKQTTTTNKQIRNAEEVHSTNIVKQMIKPIKHAETGNAHAQSISITTLGN